MTAPYKQCATPDSPLICGIRSSDRDWLCTLDPDHETRHEARDSTGKVLASWPHMTLPVPTPTESAT